MEHREVVALAVLLAMALVLGLLAMRKAAERRRFKERQSGRGKGTDV
jgi:hypothetical protein